MIETTIHIVWDETGAVAAHMAPARPPTCWRAGPTLLAAGTRPTEVAEQLKIARSSVYRIRDGG